MSVLAVARRPWRARAWLLPRLELAQFSWMVRPSVLFLATRGAVYFVAYLANLALPSAQGAGLYHAMPDNLLLDIWARWDSAFYLGIARDGYAFPHGDLPDVAFFPVYPLLLRALTGLTHNALLAGVLVSHVSFLAALLVLDRLTRLEFADQRTAERAVFYLAVFPTSVFFSAIYTESTFLLLAVATMYCARRRWWLAAGLCGALASATRSVGIVLWPVLVLEWLRSQGWSLRALGDVRTRRTRLRQTWRNWPALLVISVTPLGLASYMLFLNATFQDPMAFWTAEAFWLRGNRGVVATIGDALGAFVTGNVWTGSNVYWNVLLDLAAGALALAVGVAVFRRLGAGYGLFVFLGTLIPLWTSTISLARYVSVLFPIFMLLGAWGARPMVDRVLSGTLPVLLGVCVAIFVNWVFLG